MEVDSRDYTPTPRRLPLSGSAPATPQLHPRQQNNWNKSKDEDRGDVWQPLFPDKPRRTSSQGSVGEEAKILGAREMPLETGPYSLPEFVFKFSRSLPLCVRVENGFQSDDESQSIGVGEMYNFHLVKYSKVVELKDPNDTVYNFPLSSPVQFAPIFNDTNNDESNPDRYYAKVSDVASIKPLPKLLRVTKTYNDKDGSPLVEKNEILIVQKSVTSFAATLRRTKSLQVYSIQEHKEKTLPGECEGQFTDDPYATRLHLPDIVTFFMTEFPLYVRVYLTDVEMTEGCDFPYHLSSVTSELTGMKTETSLVASAYEQLPCSPDIDNDDDDMRKFIEIPITLEIDVTIFNPEEENKKSDLLKRTRTLLKDYASAKIQPISKTYTDLITITRKGFEREGVEFEEIYAEIGEPTTKLLKTDSTEGDYIDMATISPKVNDDDDIYDEISINSLPGSLPADKKTKPRTAPKPNILKKLPGRFNTMGRGSDKRKKLKTPPPLPQKEGVERNLSVDSATENSVEQDTKSKYQPLHKPSLSVDSYYVDLCPSTLPPAIPTTSTANPIEQPPSGDTELINRLISRIDTLEQQVADLSDKVNCLMANR